MVHYKNILVLGRGEKSVAGLFTDLKGRFDVARQIVFNRVMIFILIPFVKNLS